MRIGFGVAADDIPDHRDLLFRLPLIELEDFLYPDFADRSLESLPDIQDSLAGYPGEILLSGPYIDLNPGTPDRLIQGVVQQRFGQALAFATGINAKEIIFLSTFLPIIRLPVYEEDWVARSVDFWGAFLDTVEPDLCISLGNTFEAYPDYLVRVVEEVGRQNFKLAFDLGHFLVYSEIDLPAWLTQIAPTCSTVYVHSNDGLVDTHAEPFQGMLRPDQVSLLKQYLPEKTRLIAKPFNKSAISECVAWLEAALNQEVKA